MIIVILVSLVGVLIVSIIGKLIIDNQVRSCTLTESDEHEGKLMLFVEIREGFKKQNRVIVSNKQQVETLNSYSTYSGFEEITIGRNNHIKLVRIFDAYWLDTGESVDEEVAKDLVEQYGTREKIKKKLEEGSKLLETYGVDLRQLPPKVVVDVFERDSDGKYKDVSNEAQAQRIQELRR